MTPNEELIQDLRKAFAEESRKIKNESDARLKAHKSSIDNKIWKVLGLTVIIIGSLFAGVYGLVRNNSTGIQEIIKTQIELQNDVGIIDGVVSEKFPDNYALGNAYDKYIKTRGGGK